MAIRAGETYTHYRNGKAYVILAIGRNRDTEEEVVVYEAQYDDAVFGKNAVWVRTLKEFEVVVEKEGERVPRFIKVA